MLAGGLRRALDVVLRHQRATLAVFLGDHRLAGTATPPSPTGFFPQQDTGFLPA